MAALDAASRSLLIRTLSDDPELFSRYCLRIAPKDKARTGVIDLEYTYIQKRTHDICERMRFLGVREQFINAKARQVKLTTYWMSRAFWLHWRARGPRQTDIMGDISETTDTMQEMWDVFYNNLPREVRRPVRSHVTYKDLETGAWLRRHTALTTRKRPVQGSTSSTMIATEVPYYSHGESLLLAALNAVPNLPETLVVLEGTANGASGEFYKRWLAAIARVDELCAWFGAQDGDDLIFNRTGWGDRPDRNGHLHPHGYWDGSFYPLFWAWWQDPEYTSDPEKEQVREESLSAYERDMQRSFGLTLGQIAWYRETLRDKAGGDLKRMQQEYPSTWQEAFIMSGNTVFDPETVNKHVIRTERLAKAVREVKDPRTNAVRHVPYIQRVTLDWLEDKEAGQARYFGSPGPNQPPAQVANRNAPMFDVYGACTNKDTLRVQIEPSPFGELLLRRKPVLGWDYRYVIAADVAQGLAQGDFSGALVLDRVEMRLDMMYRGHIAEDAFGILLAKMGVYYDGAPILVEQNMQGDAVMNELRRIYAHVMSGARFEKGKMLYDQRLGWKTTDASKPQMVGALKAYIRDYPGGMPFYQPWIELTTFTQEASGKMGAEGKRLDPDTMAYDDMAITWMIVLMAHKLLPPPVERAREERRGGEIKVFQQPKYS